MNSVFFETSSLINYVYKGAGWRKQVIASLPENCRKSTSRYVIYEVARGFLRNLLVLYNRSQEMQRFSELLLYVGRSRFRPHFVGTILEAFAEFYRSGVTPEDFAETHLSVDEAQLILFRAHLQNTIRRGWRKLESEMDEVVNYVGCRDDIDAPYLRDGLYYQDLYKEQCGAHENCELKAYIARAKKDFAALRDALMKVPKPDAEAVRRCCRSREVI
jgi:hypothetical protein